VDNLHQQVSPAIFHRWDNTNISEKGPTKEEQP
jgi:hypothetical protein